MIRVEGEVLGAEVEGLGVRVRHSGFEVEGSGSGFRVYVLKVRV